MNEYQVLAFIVVPIVMAAGGWIITLWAERDARKPLK